MQKVLFKSARNISFDSGLAGSGPEQHLTAIRNNFRHEDIAFGADLIIVGRKSAAMYSSDFENLQDFWPRNWKGRLIERPVHLSRNAWR